MHTSIIDVCTEMVDLQTNQWIRPPVNWADGDEGCMEKKVDEFGTTALFIPSNRPLCIGRPFLTNKSQSSAS